MLLALLACVHPAPVVTYDPLAESVVTPLVGPSRVDRGPLHARLRNAGDHWITVHEVDVVPAGAVDLDRAKLPVELAPDASIELTGAVRGPGAVLLRTSEGVRLLQVGEGLRAVHAALPKATGTRRRDAIAATVTAAMPDVEACYTRALQRDRGLVGLLRVTLLVGDDGGVDGAELDRTTLRDGDVEACLLDRLAALDFGPVDGAGSMIVTYPFVFTPR